MDVGNDIPFTSRRSPVLCRNGCVASSQPLASSIGVDMLRRGANAAEAAIAVSAALAVLEPFNAGLGGDMFCLYYDAAKKKVSCINGSGKSPAQLSRDVLIRDCPDGAGGISSSDFKHSQHAVTVPGLAKGLQDLLTRHGTGKWTFQDLLEPAAVLAEEGFPVTPTTAAHWKTAMPVIRKWVPDGEDVPFTVDGENPPETGQLFCNPHLARVLRELGHKGASSGFYGGETGRALVEAVQRHGGLLTMEDLTSHVSLFPEPIRAQYRGVNLWQIPPNGQGVAALVALTGVQHLESKGLCQPISGSSIGSTNAYHFQIETMRMGFAETRLFVACPDHASVDTKWLLSPDRIGCRVEELFDPHTAVAHGLPESSTCTVSFQVVDSRGNAVSFVNSNFNRTGIVPSSCGFILQNRGYSFSLDPDHPNAFAGGKRPFSTMISGMLTHADSDELFATVSNIGGYMQPQGHLQLTINMVAGNLDPQAAVDMPRFCIADGTHDGTVFLEDGISDQVIRELEERGHKLTSRVTGGDRGRIFGHAQIIKRDRKTGVLWAGSDGRTDGCAMGY